MQPSAASKLTAALAALALLPGCSEQESRWPARNYSGIYAVQARVESNSCETPVFAPGDTLLFTLLHGYDNQAEVQVTPVVTVSGRFAGDRLEAASAVATPAPPPPGDTAAPAPADSIRYRIDLKFEGDRFDGTYRVEQPALGARVEECSQEFEVKGVEQVRRSAPR